MGGGCRGSPPAEGRGVQGSACVERGSGGSATWGGHPAILGHPIPALGCRLRPRGAGNQDRPRAPHGESEGLCHGGLNQGGSTCPGAWDPGHPAQPRYPPAGWAPVPAARQLTELVVSLLGLRSRTAA